MRAAALDTRYQVAFRHLTAIPLDAFGYKGGVLLNSFGALSLETNGETGGGRASRVGVRLALLTLQYAPPH